MCLYLCDNFTKQSPKWCRFVTSCVYGKPKWKLTLNEWRFDLAVDISWWHLFLCERKEMTLVGSMLRGSKSQSTAGDLSPSCQVFHHEFSKMYLFWNVCFRHRSTNCKIIIKMCVLNLHWKRDQRNIFHNFPLFCYGNQLDKQAKYTIYYKSYFF